MMTELEYGATQLKIERENEEKLKHYPILQKQLEIAKSFIFRCANDIAGDWYVNAAKCVMQKIEEVDK